MNGLPWQREQIAGLVGRAAAARLGHALLICGEPDIGKRLFAESLAAALQCRNPDSGLACGNCSCCRLNAAGSSPDRFVLQPEEPGKQIRVDDVRSMIEFVSRTTQIAACKVVLIDPADAMNRSAANSLLKSLEEPPGATYLLLVSAVPARLPATIRSRCQPLPMSLPPVDASLAWLAEQGATDAQALLQLAGGRPLAALRLGQEGDSLVAWADLAADLDAFLAGQMPLAGFVGRYTEPALLIERCNALLADLLRLLSTGNPRRLRHGRLAGGLVERAGQSNLPTLFALLEEQVAATRLLRSGSNPNPQLLVEDLMLRWREAFRATSDIDPSRPERLSFWR